ncbi:DegT/DnrJ/EryC1/StrS family aminotransferase [Candidatus Pelagibacter sp.]|jgi:dTDP-3-amino-2,3,6-trideoxy-4-keto-D-glucose/dTDP-3-amino-3,4,6-trideoxy-alpha-D-glucose/dTDP-2,6-dideoxy-D-kanosamine transaminase|nr:DegT/DnrJ/EryC1/StrS family aminotransferase [Candidatus Pelagibacter sp.]
MIKFWSYSRELKRYKKKIFFKIKKSLNSGQIFFGNELQEFEKRFITRYKSKYGVAVGSGTDALIIALKSLDIKNGDEVITAANTAIPTISAIRSVGAVPKLVDIQDNYLIDTSKIEREITKKTRAIIPVHLYGQTCEMDKVIKISKKYKLKIIEDCAQSQGAKYKNKFCGTIGELGCFSFYPTKILGAYGDGGFILTNDYDLYKRIKRIRFYGIETVDRKNKYINKYYANENGINSRLDEIQAGILNFKLSLVEKLILRRKHIAKLYFKELGSANLKLPELRNYSDHVFHLFTIYHPQRNKIVKELNRQSIETRVIYPYPIQKMNAYKKFFKSNKRLKNSEIKSKGIFCLPIYPELKDKEVIQICKSIKKILKKI